MVLHVRGIVLPEREERSLWIDGGVFREGPAACADTVVDGGWLVPGLVDVHTHPGAEQPGDPFDESLLRQHLADHVTAGVLLIRTPGSAARIPDWAHDGDGLPRVRSAGPWLATPGRFFPGWGRHVTEADLAAAAVQEAAAASWTRGAGRRASRPGTRDRTRLPRGRGAHLRRAQAAAAPAVPPPPGTAPAAQLHRRHSPGRARRPPPRPAGARSSVTGPGTSRRCRWRFCAR